MGTEAHVVVRGGGSSGPERAEARLRDLEQRWSRFISDSELSRLNRSAGAAMAVGWETSLLASLAVDAWSLTGGRFDPTVGPALVAAGYDRSFDELDSATVRTCGGAATEPAPGPAGTVVVADLAVVRLPVGASLDAGGIGKGLAADLVATELVGAGASGALVSGGGDVRVAGAPPPGGWVVEIDHGMADAIGTVALVQGAVATSSVMRRRWSTVDGEAHHVIDPRTGRPTSGAARACTVVAGEAWWAEALCTAVLVAWDEPSGPSVAHRMLSDSAALVTTESGEVVRIGSDRVELSLGVPA